MPSSHAPGIQPVSPIRGNRDRRRVTVGHEAPPRLAIVQRQLPFERARGHNETFDAARIERTVERRRIWPAANFQHHVVAQAEEAIVDLYARHAEEYDQALPNWPPTETVALFVQRVGLSLARARSVALRALARLAEAHLPEAPPARTR